MLYTATWPTSYVGNSERLSTILAYCDCDGGTLLGAPLVSAACGATACFLRCQTIKLAAAAMHSTPPMPPAMPAIDDTLIDPELVVVAGTSSSETVAVIGNEVVNVVIRLSVSEVVSPMGSDVRVCGAVGFAVDVVVVGDAMGIFVEVGNVDIAGDVMSELGVGAVVSGTADITGAVTVGDVVVVVVVGVGIVAGVNGCGAQHASICTRLASSPLAN
jgi:hypothetical protein